MAAPITLEDLRRRARRALPRLVFDFIDGGAEDEHSVRANRAGFDGLALRPRVLVDVSRRDQSVTVLGQQLSMPVLMSPTGLVRLAHRRGELAAARATSAAGTAFVLSTASSYSIEEVAAASAGPLWFQLYLWRDRDVIASLVERAAKAGYSALVLTADVPIVGQRDRDLRNGMTLPPRVTLRNALDTARRPRWLADLARGPKVNFRNFVGDAGRGDSTVALGTYVNKEMINPGATWDDLAWLRDLWQGPIAIKGIMTAEDARRAVDHGADGVVVSNHGGRQLDATLGTIEALPEVVDAVGDRVDVLLDGGVRRGTDVLKALALGAKAVMTGRPFWFGLAVDGEAGVTAALEILRTEIDRALALVGCPVAADLDPSFVTRRPR